MALTTKVDNLLNVKHLFSDDSSGETLYLELVASEIHANKSNKGKIIGVVVGIRVLLAILWSMKRMLVSRKVAKGSFVAYGYKDLQEATRDFSKKLGGGGFGSIFKGTLDDSSVVAMKKLETFSQRKKQFQQSLISLLHQQHLTPLRES
ncbi:hypothetical protein VNO80_10375 [Phaseolus coccineus]|uniref:Protein kinase domain-containing protein n=1 Tax=Phaseolus coccineus TaxID=3886 RepID=A0AAN9N8A6_PHACN